MTAFISEAVPPGVLGRTFAVANSVWQVAAPLVPSLGGLLRDLTGSFREACYLTGAVLGTAAAVIVGVFAPRDSGFFRARREGSP